MNAISKAMPIAFGGCLSIALLSGCGGLPAQNGLMQFQARRSMALTHPDFGPSWMSPDAVSRAELLYVTDPTDGDVYALSLPTGKLVGKLTGFNQPLGDCVDARGDVFITISQSAQVREYKHGAKQPFNVLSDAGYYPNGCSVDPTTGNLAVSNIIGNGNGSDPGNVAVYTKAKGKPKYYAISSIYQYGYCAYDGQGNLFIDGTSPPPSDAPQFAELPKGSRSVHSVTLNGNLGGYEALQWDGKYIAVGGVNATIYRFAINGSSGTEAGSTSLKGEEYLLGFWIRSTAKGSTLYAPVFQSESLGDVGVYAYPAGGKASKDYYAVVDPWSAAVSIKPESDGRTRF